MYAFERSHYPALLADPEIFQQNRLPSMPILQTRPVRKCP